MNLKPIVTFNSRDEANNEAIMVRIVNWLLTRRCNLKCEYCGIVKIGSPEKPISYYKKNEISTERVIALLDKFRTYNPNVFHIFYGGEPFLRSDLSDILKFCNETDIKYTVISNCTLDIQPKIWKVMRECGGFRGFTGSVDPTILLEPEDPDSHSQLKSASAFGFLVALKRHVEDVVAEITMTKQNMDLTYELIQLLSSAGIYSSLTAIDVNKNYMYDFSAYSDGRHLIKDSKKLAELYMKLAEDDSLLIHMKDVILPKLFAHIDSTYDCNQGENIHNITIDADGTLRTCLRIRGESMGNINVDNLLMMNDPYGYRLNDLLRSRMTTDKHRFCYGCNHTCVMMSEHVDKMDNADRIINH